MSPEVETETPEAHAQTPYRALSDQAALGIGERSADGRWRLVNEKLCQILGYRPSELVAMRVADHTHPQDVRGAHACFEDLLRGLRADVSRDERYVRADGTMVWVRTVTVRVRAPEGNYLVAVVEDISLRKSAEAEAASLRDELEARVAERTAQLAEAVRGLEAFSYSVSHDLRTPLRAISGFAQILARRHRDSLNDEGRHYMDNIVRASAQMGQLIEDLLAYSRLGRQAIRLEALALGELMAQALAQFAPRIAELDACVTVQAELPTVLGDETLLTQILLNLVDNALTYCRPGERPWLTIDCRIRGEEVVLLVQDRGIGIADEHFETIFGVFERLHTRDEYPGTGIGLATVKQAVERLGGKVWLESKLGEGSTFYVSLPAARC